MARTTPAQNPRGCARYTSIGLPLRKLHHNHQSPERRDRCNIRTMHVQRPGIAAQTHGTAGLCVKKSRPRKDAWRKVSPEWFQATVILYRNSEPLAPAPRNVTLSPLEAVYTDLQ